MRENVKIEHRHYLSSPSHPLPAPAPVPKKTTKQTKRSSAKDAASALRALRDLLKSLGVCDGRFELGEVRCDLNVSMWKGEGEMGDR